MIGKDTEYVKILEKIKVIRPLIRGYEIQLPQIVVIGDQSSGKSSVLESLTGIKFPVNSGICTRCPIIVNCKNDKQIKENQFTINGKKVQIQNLSKEILKIQDKNLIINKNITVNGNSSDDDFPKKKYYNSSDDEKLSNDDFPKKKYYTSSDDEKISDDDLKVEKKKISDTPIEIEVIGNLQVDLIVIDLPGLIHNGDGKDEVKDLIKQYINNERTLVLVCTPGDADEETQEALEITKNMKHRRMRILTKFDGFTSKDNSKKAIELLKSQENKELGCHAVVCRHKAKPDYDTTIEMEIFEEFGINKLKNIGLSNLKNRLPPLFSDLIKKELPNIKDELLDNIKKEKEILKKIGISKLDSRSIIREYKKTFEDEVKINEYNTKLFEDLQTKIREIKENINIEYVQEKYKKNIFKPIFYQGENIFNEYIYNIVSNQWKPLYEDYYKIIYNNFTKMSYKTKTDNFSKELVNCVEKIWKIDIEKYLNTLNDECIKLFDETKIFGTVNHYLTAKYQEFLEIPDETKKEFIQNITEDMLLKKDWQDKIVRNSNGSAEMADLSDIKKSILELLNKTLDNRKTEWLSKALGDQQIERIFCQVEAVICVEYKNTMDALSKKIRDVILFRTEWINNLSTNQDVYKYAFENESIDIKRNSIKKKIESYEKALEIIEN
jgi:GTP-binding protein EngB required for normal cell division